MSKSELRRMLRIARLTPGACRGIGQLLMRGEADLRSWRAWLLLHCATNGGSTDLLTRLMQVLRPAPAPIVPFDSLLGHFDAARVKAAADQIERDGYFVFEQRVPAALCDEIAAAARTTEAVVRPSPERAARNAVFDPDNPLGRVYDFTERQNWTMAGCQRVIGDPVFVNVSQAYIGAATALKNVNMWWSATFDDRAETDDYAAQQFHFDYDPAPKWLKFFVYVTDVDAESGPHIFVRGSHRRRQPHLRDTLARGYVRIADGEIEQLFGRDNVVELVGARGTVLAVDTMGFHKGKPPRSRSRLIMQLEYATPLFIASVSDPVPVPATLDPALLASRSAYPWAFQRYPQTH